MDSYTTNTTLMWVIAALVIIMIFGLLGWIIVINNKVNKLKKGKTRRSYDMEDYPSERQMKSRPPQRQSNGYSSPKTQRNNEEEYDDF